MQTASHQIVLAGESSDAPRSLIREQIQFATSFTLGIAGNNLAEGREKDRFGIGYFYYGISDDLRPAFTNLLGGIQNGQGVELFYNFSLNDQTALTFDTQILRFPIEEVRYCFLDWHSAKLHFLDDLSYLARVYIGLTRGLINWRDFSQKQARHVQLLPGLLPPAQTESRSLEYGWRSAGSNDPRECSRAFSCAQHSQLISDDNP